jgi:hypothetical protein
MAVTGLNQDGGRGRGRARGGGQGREGGVELNWPRQTLAPANKGEVELH